MICTYCNTEILPVISLIVLLIKKIPADLDQRSIEFSFLFPTVADQLLWLANKLGTEAKPAILSMLISQQAPY